jgi:hypothetical protein
MKAWSCSHKENSNPHNNLFRLSYSINHVWGIYNDKINKVLANLSGRSLQSSLVTCSTNLSGRSLQSRLVACSTNLSGRSLQSRLVTCSTNLSGRSLQSRLVTCSTNLSGRSLQSRLVTCSANLSARSMQSRLVTFSHSRNTLHFKLKANNISLGLIINILPTWCGPNSSAIHLVNISIAALLQP